MYKAANGLNKGMSKRYCDISNKDLLEETRKLKIKQAPTWCVD